MRAVSTSALFSTSCQSPQLSMMPVKCSYNVWKYGRARHGTAKWEWMSTGNECGWRQVASLRHIALSSQGNYDRHTCLTAATKLGRRVSKPVSSFRPQTHGRVTFARVERQAQHGTGRHRLFQCFSSLRKILHHHPRTC